MSNKSRFLGRRIHFCILFAVVTFLHLETVGALPGDLYISEINGTILKHSPTAGLTTVITGLSSPRGLTFDNQGNLYIAASTSILTIDGDRNLNTFSVTYDSPFGIAFNTAGSLYVSNGNANNIYRIDPHQTPPFAQNLNGPRGIAVDASGNVFVANLGDASILKFTPGGVKSVFDASAGRIVGLAFDSSGNLFASNLDIKSIVKYAPNGDKTTFAFGLNFPEGIVFDANNNLFVADLNDNKVYEFTPDGTKYTIVSGLSSPGFLAIEPTPHSLLNISTRGSVLTGDGALIGGFIVGGNSQVGQTVVARAIGPSLAGLGVSGALQDPFLEIHDATGAVIATNDSWQADKDAAQIQNLGLAPTDAREAALFLSLPAGAYTAVVKGTSNSTGVALVEVYNVPSPPY